MRRPLLACLFAWALAGTALSGPTLEELQQDGAKKKELEKGRKALDKYFKAEAEEKKGGGKGVRDKALAQEEFFQWLAASGGTALGLDMRTQPDLVIQMLDEARVKYLETKFKKGSIEYVKVEDAQGMKRHEYAILVPPSYEPSKRRIPVILSLHGRVTNPQHPAFRSGNAQFAERAREAVWNNWLKTPAAEQALVIAPTTNPDGFQFGENHYEDLQALFRTLGEALTEYRGDWDRIFLEVHGKAFRVALEQALVFAGIIVRDRPEDRKAPFLPPEHFFLLENLNGTPLCYVADLANWNAVGKPMSEALEAAYKAAGKPENLLVVKAQRDVDGALRGGEDQIKEFVQKHARPKSRDRFTWRFFDPGQINPLPIGDIDANYAYDTSKAARKAPLAAKAGRLSFEARRETVNGQDVNRIDIRITEAEGLKISFIEPTVNLDLPVAITINGAAPLTIDGAAPKSPEPRKFERDWELFFDEILPLRFFMLPFLNRVSVSFPHKQEFQEPPGEGDKGAKPGEQQPDGTKPAEGTPAGGSTPAESGGDKKTSGR